MTKKSTKIELKERQKTITAMTIRGFCKREIMSYLNISSSTYERDMRKIRQENVESLRKNGPMDIFLELNLRRLGRIRRLWRIADSQESTTREKIAALSSLRDEDSAMITIMQGFGIMKKEMDFHAMANEEERQKEKKSYYEMVLGIKGAQRKIAEEEAEKKRNDAWKNANISGMLDDIERLEELKKLKGEKKG